MMTPTQIVQAQLDAYNAKDVDALLATYAEDAEHYELHGALLARGHAQLRQRFTLRFAEPDLHAELLSRQVLGDVVVDLERITRNFPDGRGSLDMLCIYQIANGRIGKASFVAGIPQIPAPSPR